jgi:predicted  nucleic acid-binding Zn-ribbon protein
MYAGQLEEINQFLNQQFEIEKKKIKKLSTEISDLMKSYQILEKKQRDVILKNLIFLIVKIK